MTQQARNDALAWDQGGNRQLFTKPSYRKRMWMGFFVQYAAQTTGAMVVYIYVVQLYKNLGETGGIPLILGAAYVTVAAISNFLGAFVMDKAGRVTLLSRLFMICVKFGVVELIPAVVIGLSGCMVSLALETAMVARFAGTSDKAGNSLGVFFTFCFISFYGGGIDVVSYVYCSEIFPTHIRSQGMAWSIVGTFLSTLVYVEAGPTALANIQWKYYLIFVCLTFVNIVIIYFWLPEVSWTYRMRRAKAKLTRNLPQTKGLSLEEINGRFGDEVIVHFQDATDKQKASLEATVAAEGGFGGEKNQHMAGTEHA